MPILDVEPVLLEGAAMPSVQALADAAARVFGSPPGRTWVRLRPMNATAYAENEVLLDTAALPVFVTVLHAHLPPDDALAAQVSALTQAIATVCGTDAQRVHVHIAPAAAGRQAFGGMLVR